MGTNAQVRIRPAPDGHDEGRLAGRLYQFPIGSAERLFYVALVTLALQGVPAHAVQAVSLDDRTVRVSGHLTGRRFNARQMTANLRDHSAEGVTIQEAWTHERAWRRMFCAWMPSTHRKGSVS